MNTKKKNRRTLVLQDRINILSEIDAGRGYSDIAAKYGITISGISKIKERRAKLMSFSKTVNNTKLKKLHSVRLPQNVNLEKALYEWISQQISWGQPMTGPLLCEKALEINESLGGSSSFKASQGWLNKFKARHGISISKISMQGEILPSGSEAAENFPEEFQALIQDNEYDFDDIYNADETGLNWKNLPWSTSDENEITDQGFKINNDRLTAMMCANASGTHKIPILIIGKFRKPKCFNNVKCLSVIYKAQKNAWMDKTVFLDWYTYDFIPSVIERQKNDDKPGKVLLLLDNAPSHPNVDILNAINENFKVMYLPTNATTDLQPMGQGVIEKCKKLYKKILLKSMFIETKTQEQFLNQLTIRDCCEMIAEAWANVSEFTLQKAWRHLIPLNIPRESDSTEESSDLFDYFIDNDSSEDIVSWLDQEEDDQGWEPHDVTQFVSTLDGQETPLDPPDYEDETDEVKTNQEIPEVLPREIFKSVSTFYKWAQMQNECKREDLASIKKLLRIAEKKTAISKI